MLKVDYDNSILALTSSILNHYGIKNAHKTLGAADGYLEKGYKNVVLMLFDGMGMSTINRFLGKDSFLTRHLKCEISSVFPPTTTAATTTVCTGMSPIEHGWLGWSLYFDEIDKNVDIFPNVVSCTNEAAADYNVAQRYIGRDMMFDKIRQSFENVEPFMVSPFSSYKSQSASDVCNTVSDICAKEGKKYIYAYWTQPDSDMHEFGATAPRIGDKVREINDLVEKMCSRLSDTLVFIIADHGHVDVKTRYLEDYSDITRCLVREASMEARALSLFVKNGKENEFESAFNRAFADCFKLFTKQQIYEMGLFGNGDVHPRSDGFIGDYMAIAYSDVIIQNYRSESRFLGAHAGFTRDEMYVPLIVIEKE